MPQVSESPVFELVSVSDSEGHEPKMVGDAYEAVHPRRRESDGLEEPLADPALKRQGRYLDWLRHWGGALLIVLMLVVMLVLESGTRARSQLEMTGDGKQGDVDRSLSSNRKD
jgi:hypothetical protein